MTGCFFDKVCLPRPPFVFSMHLCCTMQTTAPGVADRFISDVKHEVAELMKNPSGATTGVVSRNTFRHFD